MCAGEVGLQADGFPQCGRRVWQVSLLFQNRSQRVIRLGVLRVNLDRSAQFFDGAGEVSLLPERDAESVAGVRLRGIELRRTYRTVAADVGAILDKLPSLADAKPGKVGLVGYCMSGAFVTVAAARHPDRIGCFASYYGTRLITDKPDSPHLMLSDIKAEGYYSFAEHDTYVPLDQVAAFEKLLASVPFPSRSETELGTHHGYAFTDRGNYNQAACEKHYERMLALYRLHLSS